MINEHSDKLFKSYVVRRYLSYNFICSLFVMSCSWIWGWRRVFDASLCTPVRPNKSYQLNNTNLARVLMINNNN